MAEQVRILCVDDERNVLRALERLFLDDDYELLTAISSASGSVFPSPRSCAPLCGRTRT